MELLIKALRELSDLLRTRFKEVTIIVMAFVIYKQFMINQALNTTILVEKERGKQEQIGLFREVMNKTYLVQQAAGKVIDKADTLISKNTTNGN